jgi:putative sugar O-methyltransferase
MKDFKQNVDFFIKNSKNFYNDSFLENIDKKHQSIVGEAYNSIETSFSIDKIRNWSGQSDHTPHFKVTKLLRFLVGDYSPKLKLFTKILTFFRLKFTNQKFTLSGLLDDISIIEILGGGDLLLNNPQDKSPGSDSKNKINGYSVSHRWLRYIYILNQIINKKLICNNMIWVDIGSFYGGLQGLVRRYFPKSKIVMVDFHHQLLRSYLYLNELHPNSIHILPNDLKKYNSFDDLPDNCFVYIPVNEFNHIKNFRCHLFTNFYSFGEMKREYFLNYFNSNLLKSADKIYMVNRFVSSPFFEKTYDSDLNYNDYIIKNRVPIYFDIFPMGHYFIIPRNLFGRDYFRNISSSYFEIIY